MDIVGVLKGHCRPLRHLHILFVDASQNCQNSVSAYETTHNFLGMLDPVGGKFAGFPILSDVLVGTGSVSSLSRVTGLEKGTTLQ